MSIALPAGNPVKAIRKPTQPKARDRRLRAGELDYLLAAAAMSRAVGVKEVLLLAVETNMRMGELFSLRWEYIKINPGKGKKSTTGTAHLLDTKNGESRTVALSSAAVEALHALPHRIDGKVFSWKPNHENGSFEKVWQRTLARARKQYEAV